MLEKLANQFGNNIKNKYDFYNKEKGRYINKNVTRKIGLSM